MFTLIWGFYLTEIIISTLDIQSSEGFHIVGKTVISILYMVNGDTKSLNKFGKLRAQRYKDHSVLVPGARKKPI